MSHSICPHCNESYNDVGDAFCPHCHEDLLDVAESVTGDRDDAGEAKPAFRGRVKLRANAVGECVYDCRTIRSEKSLRRSNVLGAVLISLVVVVFVSIIATMVIVKRFEQLYPHLGVVLIVVHVCVGLLVLPLAIFSSLKNPLNTKFTLYDNALRYGKNYWALDSIVSVKRGIGGSFGTINKYASKVGKFVKPAQAQVMEQNEQSALHLVFADNSTTTLFGAFDLFEPNNINVLLWKIKKIQPAIEVRI